MDKFIQHSDAISILLRDDYWYAVGKEYFYILDRNSNTLTHYNYGLLLLTEGRILSPHDFSVNELTIHLNEDRSVNIQQQPYEQNFEYFFHELSNKIGEVH
jgi:hypothetical protein